MSTSVLLIIGTCAILTLVFFVIIFVLIHQKRMFENKVLIKENENRHQKKLIDASIEVAELEREKMAKDIHDDVGSVLNITNLHLNRISRNSDNKILTKQLIIESKELLDLAIENIRGLTRSLMPPILIRLGYEKGLMELCRQIEVCSAIKTEFITSEHEFTLSKTVEVQLYRIVQEVVNNIIKHANASKINISIQYGSTLFSTEIKHNGAGINSEMINKLSEANGGVGLRSIQSRAQMINANVQFITISENEALIIIEIPIYEITD